MHFDRLQNRPRPKLLVLRLEVQVVDRPGEVFGSFQFALDDRFIDDHVRRDVRQFASLPGFHLCSYGLEVVLHSINARPGCSR